jgi:hypothetical protein
MGLGMKEVTGYLLAGILKYRDRQVVYEGGG